jgi:YbgC/YbaW family acyl-CoA thioester hydrolase
MKIAGSKFESEITVRPSDIDMNHHVHNTIYLDYVLAARYDQMARCYKMSMEEFLGRGYTWWVRKAYIEHKKGLTIGDIAVVRTWVDEVERSRVTVNFEIVHKSSGALSASGYLEYVMITANNGRPATIPQDILDKYSV